MRPEPEPYYPIAVDRLPPTWELVWVGDVVRDIQPGFASGQHNQEGRGVPHLRPMNIDRDGNLNTSVLKFVEDASGNRVMQGDVLFNNTNSPELVGKTTYIDRAIEWAFSNHMTRLRPAVGLHPGFIAHQLHYLWRTGYFRYRCTHHVNQASVASETLARTTPFVLAPTPEQDRIVAEIEKHFTRLDAAVAALKRVQANLKRYRVSVLKAACEGRLVPTEAKLARQEHRGYETGAQLLERIAVERRRLLTERTISWLGRGRRRPYQEPVADTSDPNLPLGWASARWQEVGISQNGRAFPSDEYQASGIRLLRPGNLFADGTVRWSHANARHLPCRFAAENPDLLVGSRELVMNLTAQSLKDDFLGRVCITGPSEQCLLNQRLARLHPVLLLPEYVLWFFKSPPFRRFVASLNTGSLIQHMFTSQLDDARIPVPPQAEQMRIVLELERRFSVADALEQAVATALARAVPVRNAILRSAFAGTLADQDPHDEPAMSLLGRLREEQQANRQGPGRQRRPRPASSVESS